VSSLIHILALAAATTSPLPFDRSEPTCIADEISRLDQAKVSYHLPDTVRPCQERYKWTSGDVETALKVTRALIVMSNTRKRAGEAGIDLAAVDDVTAKMGADAVASFGWEGSPLPVPPALLDATRQLPASFSPDDRMKGGLVILYWSIAHNAIDAFIRQRLGR